MAKFEVGITIKSDHVRRLVKAAELCIAAFQEFIAVVSDSRNHLTAEQAPEKAAEAILQEGEYVCTADPAAGPIPLAAVEVANRSMLIPPAANRALTVLLREGLCLDDAKAALIALSNAGLMK